MGIVRLYDGIHDQLRKASKVFDRSMNAQAEHWLKVGILSEFHPEMNYEALRKLLFLHQDLSLEKTLGVRRK